MKTPIIALAGTLCLGAVMVGTPATAFAAGTATTPSASPTAAVPVPDPVSIRLSGLTATQGTITIKGTANATASIVQTGVTGSVVKRMGSGGETTHSFPLTSGQTASFSVTQTVTEFGGTATATSSPMAFTATNDVTSVARPVIKDVFEVDNDTVPVRVDGQPGAEIEVVNSLGDNALAAPCFMSERGSMVIPVNLRSDKGPTTGRFSVTQSWGGHTSAIAAFGRDDQAPLPEGDLTAPTVSAVMEGEFVRLMGTSDVVGPGAQLVWKNLDGNAVARVEISSGHPAVTYLRAPRNEAVYTATVRTLVDEVSYESAATRLVVNEGIGLPVPEAPVIDTVTAAGTRTVATVSGTPGATLIVRNSAGSVLALRKIGSRSSSASLVIPVGARSGQPLSITQTLDDVSSNPTPFTTDTK